MNKEEKNNKKLSLKERWNDKRERAKLELIAYGIFFLIIIIFARIGNANTNIQNTDNNNTFINDINDNYEYNIEVNINDEIYNYHGKVLGYNGNLTKNNDNYYYIMNDKYYVLNNGNYILTNKEEVYDNIDYKYLDIKNIKEYISLGRKENNIYNIKLSDIILNNTSEEYITISLNETDNIINIDYTNLLKTNDSKINKAIVNISYTNINKIISLEE